MGSAVKYAVYEFVSTRVMHFAFRSIEYYASDRYLYDVKAALLRCTRDCPVVCIHGDGSYACAQCRDYAKRKAAVNHRQLLEHFAHRRPAMPALAPCTRCKRDKNVNEHDFLRCGRCDASWCAKCWWRSDALATYCGDDEG